VQFELPGEHMVTLVNAPFTIPAGFAAPPPALMDITLFAGPAIGLFPAVVLLLPPQPRAHMAAPIRTQDDHLDTAPPFVLVLT
jgi:hypothetical protein